MDAPIVVTELYEVAPGHEADFYSWGTAVIQAVARVGGYLGGDVRDPEYADGEWQIVHRWADRELAQDWDASSTRARWLAAAESFARPSPTRMRPRRRPPADLLGQPESAGPQLAAGEEPPAAPASSPPQWKMAVVTLTAVFPPVLFFNITLIPQLRNVSVVLRTLILCVGVTAVVTWIMMPRLMRLFRRWLNPDASPAPAGSGSGAAYREQYTPSHQEEEAATEVFPRFQPASGAAGARPRPPGRAAQPAPTTTLDPTDPYLRRR
jgi:antibiotic biosynthesis monooxygenase (ABM) superfamily enzyme